MSENKVSFRWLLFPTHTVRYRHASISVNAHWILRSITPS